MRLESFGQKLGFVHRSHFLVTLRHRADGRTPNSVTGSGNTRQGDVRRQPMKIKLTSVYVANQEQALRFYTDVLGFVKKADFSQGPFRWLTVVSKEDPEGTELQLALNDNPA